MNNRDKAKPEKPQGAIAKALSRDFIAEAAGNEPEPTVKENLTVEKCKSCKDCKHWVGYCESVVGNNNEFSNNACPYFEASDCSGTGMAEFLSMFCGYLIAYRNDTEDGSFKAYCTKCGEDCNTGRAKPICKICGNGEDQEDDTAVINVKELQKSFEAKDAEVAKLTEQIANGQTETIRLHSELSALKAENERLWKDNKELTDENYRLSGEK